jgi:hypothetical protein
MISSQVSYLFIDLIQIIFFNLVKDMRLPRTPRTKREGSL